MAHTDRCIRSDGDWLCAGGCPNDADEAEAALRKDITELTSQLVQALAAVESAAGSFPLCPRKCGGCPRCIAHAQIAAVRERHRKAPTLEQLCLRINHSIWAMGRGRR
jgi:hypothetical protein